MLSGFPPAHIETHIKRKGKGAFTPELDNLKMWVAV